MITANTNFTLQTSPRIATKIGLGAIHKLSKHVFYYFWPTKYPSLAKIALFWPTKYVPQYAYVIYELERPPSPKVVLWYVKLTIW